MTPELGLDCWKRIGVRGDKSCPELRPHIHCHNCPTFERAARTLLDREPPPGYVEEWTRLLAQGKADETRHTEAAAVFRIGTEWLALPAQCWVEVVALRPIRRLPHRSNPVLAGLVSVRGEVLPCLSLAPLLGLSGAGQVPQPAAPAKPRLMVVCKDRFKLAFPADDVMGLQRFSRDRVEAIPATNAHAVPRFCRGVVSLEGRKVGLLDEERVFRALAKELA